MSADLEALLVAPDLVDDPYPTYKRLREEAPVFWSDRVNGWVLTRYDDVTATFNDHAHFKNSGRFEPVFDAVDSAHRPEFAPMRKHYQYGVIGADPPDHTRLRGLVVKAFTARRVEDMRARIQASPCSLLPIA